MVAHTGNPSVWRLRQKDSIMFEAILYYIVRSCIFFLMQILLNKGKYKTYRSRRKGVQGEEMELNPVFKERNILKRSMMLNG